MTHLSMRAMATCAGTLVFLMGPTASAQDFTIKIGGRLMIDYTSADLDGAGDISKNELRRARLNASGSYGDGITYKFEFNKTGDSEINVEDAYIKFAPQGSAFKFKVGQFKTHNSLDEENSSRFMSTIERAAFTDAFALDRRVGVSVGTSGSNYTFDAGAYTTNLEEDGGNEEGKAYAVRATYNPVKTDETIVHLGASWRARENGDTTDDLRYRQRPYAHVSPSRIIDTGRFADSDSFVGVEGAVLQNNFWAAGEYAVLNAQGSDGNPDGEFNGFYAEVGAFFGGKKTYKSGKFGRPKVDNPFGSGGNGAFSLVARYDSLDLNDGIYTGELQTTVLGADWWPTKNTRMSVNYFNADATDGAYQSGQGFVSRLYFDF